MTKSNCYRGYVFSRKVGTSIVPQRVQNTIIRLYAEKRSLTYLLSTTEYEMENCYMVLRSTLDELDALDGIIFYSLEMLPHDAEFRKKLYEKFISKGKSLHFALEELRVSNNTQALLIEDVLMTQKISGNLSALN